MHRRLVNEAGDVSEDMEMGRHFHVPAENFCLRCDSTLPFWFHGGSACYIPKQVSMHGGNSIGYVFSN